MSQPKLNPLAAPFHPEKIPPPPPPPPYPFFLHAHYYYHRETRIFRTFSKVRRSPPKPVTKPAPKPPRRFVVPRQRKTAYRKRVSPQPMPKNPFSGNSNGGNGNGDGGGGRTTVMIKNIPCLFRRNMMIEFLDKVCEENNLEYDFLYLPMDFRRGNSLGYAFVNLTTPRAASKITELLRGYKWDSIQSRKICEVSYARLQGKEALVGNFQRSLFRCSNKEWLPVVFTPARNGSAAVSAEIIIGNVRVVK